MNFILSGARGIDGIGGKCENATLVVEGEKIKVVTPGKDYSETPGSRFFWIEPIGVGSWISLVPQAAQHKQREKKDQIECCIAGPCSVRLS